MVPAPLAPAAAPQGVPAPPNPPAVGSPPPPVPTMPVNPLAAMIPMTPADVDGMPMPGMERAAAPHLETEGLVELEPVDEVDVSALGVLPDLFKEDGKPDAHKLGDLAMRIVQAIGAGEQQLGRLPERWERNEAFARNKHLPPTRLPWPGAHYFHVPAMGPRLDQRKATFVQTIVGVRPHVRVRRLGGDREPITAIEDTLQFMFDAGNFERFLNRYAESINLKNKGLARVTFEQGEDGMEEHGITHTGRFALPLAEYIDPRDFVIYPANAGGIHGARVVGHGFDQMASAVKVRQRAGDWLEGDVMSHPTKEERRRAKSQGGAGDLQNPSQSARDFDDENVQLFDVVWRADEDDDGIEERYRVVLSRNPDLILRLEPMEGGPTGYHASQVKHEDGVFWTESSPAQDLQGIQIVLNTTVNQNFWASEMASRPAVMMEGGDVSGAKNYRPGEWKTVRHLEKAMPIPSQYDPKFFTPLVEFLRETLDTSSRTSDAITGGPSNEASPTATEQSIKLQGFQTGVSDGISEATPGILGVAVNYILLLDRHWDDWYPVYKDSVPKDLTREMLRGQFTLELGGRSPSDSPQAVAAQGQNLIGLVAQAKDVIPNAGEIVLQLIKTLFEASNLPGKHDFVSAIDAALQQQQAMAAPGGASALPSGGAEPPAGGAPGAPPPPHSAPLPAAPPGAGAPSAGDPGGQMLMMMINHLLANSRKDPNRGV